MVDNWEEVRLGDVANTRNGAGVKQESFAESGIPLARISDFTDGSISLENCLFVAEEFAGRWANYILQEGDVIIATVGSWPPNWASVVGKVVRVSKESVGAIQNQNTCCVLAKHGLSDQRFLFYILRSKDFLFYAGNASTGSANQARLPVKNVENYSFLLPPLTEQRRIAHILGTLDDKIELNRRQNETLESLARALFQSWFVDFDPVRAKASGETEAAICQRLGLSPQVLALFPAALEDSALGEVPAGWEVKPLPELVAINPTRSLKKAAVAPYLDMANVPAHSARINNVVERAFGSGTKFINGDTLLARITPCLENGKTAYVDFLEENQVGWGSTEFIVLRPKAPLPTEFGYLLARHEAFRAFAIAHMEGTSGRQRVPANCFNNYFMAKPSKAVAELFSEIVQPLMHQVKQQDEESRTLAALRDELLPRLLSGELSANL